MLIVQQPDLRLQRFKPSTKYILGYSKKIPSLETYNSNNLGRQVVEKDMHIVRDSILIPEQLLTLSVSDLIFVHYFLPEK